MPTRPRSSFEDQGSRYDSEVLEALGSSEAFIPALGSLELANALLVAQRRRRLTRADVTRFLSLVRALPITIDDTPGDRLMDALLALGSEHDLSSHDATYLELALRLGLPLATLDERLGAAAQRAGVATTIEK